jgi:hypothetical protein
MVNDADDDLARLFSTYLGIDAVGTSDLVFDFDASGTSVSGLRLVCRGIVVESTPLNFADDGYHHLAVTYDDGAVTLYLDGTAAGQAWLPGGAPVVLPRNLSVGNDAGASATVQLAGHIDDLLVLGRVLTADEIATLARDGAEMFFGIVNVAADFDDDADVDLGDFAWLQYCFAGPNRAPFEPSCAMADFDGDADVDLADFGTFQACYGGPNRLPACL